MTVGRGFGWAGTAAKATTAAARADDAAAPARNLRILWVIGYSFESGGPA
ncbi:MULTISPECIES: hypothetical protein [Rhodococcus]|nr:MULTISPECIES: hypothetical protein [Rhodococcus]QQZ11985.1 hypothetical protein GO592_19385 [Rhodococcus sp. 21391]